MAQDGSGVILAEACLLGIAATKYSDLHFKVSKLSLTTDYDLKTRLQSDLYKSTGHSGRIKS